MAYGDGHLYIVQAESDRDPVPTGPIKHNRTLTVSLFTASYPATRGGRLIADWNIDCSFGNSLAKVAKGKLYCICVVRTQQFLVFVAQDIRLLDRVCLTLSFHNFLYFANDTDSKLYVFDGTTYKTQGPLRLMGESATQTSRSYAWTLAYGKSYLEEPQFTIFQVPGHDYAVDVYAITTSENLTSIQILLNIQRYRLEWTYRTSK